MAPKRTPFYALHVKQNAHLVDFSGWDMPLHYGSQLEEHRFVRQAVGVFDVSHMRIVDLQGPEAFVFLRHLLANDVAKLTAPGDALYTCMLNEQGGIKDDLIVYFVQPDFYRLVVNAGTAEKDLAWIQTQAKGRALQIDPQNTWTMLALQGPRAPDVIHQLFAAKDAARLVALRPFKAAEVGAAWIGRTGYTGEDGFEIMAPEAEGLRLWERLMALGVPPCGLGARDTLRLEAGLNLYGSDMDESITPLESNLEWTVAWEPADRDFIGKAALLQQKKQGVSQVLVGLIMDEPGVLRSHQHVKLAGEREGLITSGSFSPVLGKAIAFARVPTPVPETVMMDRRGKPVVLRVVKPLFVRRGRITTDVTIHRDV